MNLTMDCGLANEHDLPPRITQHSFFASHKACALFSDTPSSEALLGVVLAFILLRLPRELVAVVGVNKEPGYMLANKHMNKVLELYTLT